jgi:hypothetical protein
VRTDIENPQRRIGLHDLKLFGILIKEVAVGEKDVHECG